MSNKHPSHKLPKGHKFGGRKSLPDDIREARNLSYEDMCRTVIQVRNLTLSDIRKLDQRLIPLGERAIIKAYSKLDYRGIKIYEDRLWGKAKETIDLSASGGLEIIITRIKADA